jgi:hypothetical protein
VRHFQKMASFMGFGERKRRPGRSGRPQGSNALAGRFSFPSSENPTTRRAFQHAGQPDYLPRSCLCSYNRSRSVRGMACVARRHVRRVGMHASLSPIEWTQPVLASTSPKKPKLTRNVVAAKPGMVGIRADLVRLAARCANLGERVKFQRGSNNPRSRQAAAGRWTRPNP